MMSSFSTFFFFISSTVILYPVTVNDKYNIFALVLYSVSHLFLKNVEKLSLSSYFIQCSTYPPFTRFTFPTLLKKELKPNKTRIFVPLHISSESSNSVKSESYFLKVFFYTIIILLNDNYSV